jgi:hypothetical protein
MTGYCALPSRSWTGRGVRRVASVFVRRRRAAGGADDGTRDERVDALVEMAFGPTVVLGLAISFPTG